MSINQDNKELKTLARRGAMWAFARHGAVQVIRFGGNLILSRLLFEEAFGLMALVAAIIQGLVMFSDFGIYPSIVRSQRGDDQDFLNTAWTIQVVRGFALWLCCFLLSTPVALFYEEPMLEWMLPIIGTISIVSGFASTKQVTLSRHMHLGRLAMLEIIAQLVGLLTMVGLALAHRSVWPLIVGSITTAVVRTALTVLMLPGVNNRFHWDRAASRELFKFGRWIFVSTILTFASQSADRVIFGKAIGMQLLGVYSIAKVIASVPSEALGQIGTQVLYPMYCRMVAKGVDLRKGLRHVRRPLIIAAGWVLTILVAGGDSLVSVFYDSRYHGAGWILQLLSVASWFQILEVANGGVLLAMGKTSSVAAGNGAKTFGVLVLVPLAYYYWGFPAAVAALIVCDVAKYAVSCVAVSRQQFSSVAQDIPFTCLMLGTAGLSAWLARSLDVGDLSSLLVITAVSTAAWSCFLPSVLRQSR